MLKRKPRKRPATTAESFAIYQAIRSYDAARATYSQAFRNAGLNKAMVDHAANPTDESAAAVDAIERKLRRLDGKITKAKAAAIDAYERAGMVSWQSALVTHRRWQATIDAAAAKAAREKAITEARAIGVEAARKVRSEGGTEEQAQAAGQAAFDATRREQRT
jgi:hypothetical protein